MRELALHILDLAENSVTAQAQNITICVTENLTQDRLGISVTDDGKGMDAETVARVIDPFVTSRTTRKVGLGIPLLKEAAEACNGSLEIVSTPGIGTRVLVDFQHSHIDRMPLGDLSWTCLSLLIAHPEVHWIFDYQVATPKNGAQQFLLDDEPIKTTLEGIPLTDPTILEYLRDVIEGGIAQLQSENQLI